MAFIGYTHFTIFDRSFDSPDYFLEYGNDRVSKSIRIYASYRPSAFIEEEVDVSVLQFGLKYALLTANKIEPFIQIGSQINLINGFPVTKDRIPPYQVGIGIRYFMFSNYAIEGAFLLNEIPSYRIGIVSEIF